MFDFFEGLIENLGIKLVSDFNKKLLDYINNLLTNNSEENNNSSGNFAQIGSSGDDAKIGSSGRYAQIGSSGDFAQIGSSGDDAKIGSSGDDAQIGSSGDVAQIGSSGNRAQIGSSGDYAQIDIKGDNSIGFDCGITSMIKAKKGTWISLAEYRSNEDNKIIPIFAKSAQIGNKDYTDYKGQALEENTYYILWKKEFYPVAEYDGIWTIILSEKNRENIKIIKAVDINNLLDEEIKEIYIAQEGELSAHGYTIREAVEDLTFKKMENVNVDEVVAEIKKIGKVTRSQYRAITGACLYGTERFCKEHNIQDLEEIELEELRKILINDYGAEKFWNLIEKEN